MAVSFFVVMKQSQSAGVFSAVCIVRFFQAQLKFAAVFEGAASRSPSNLFRFRKFAAKLEGAPSSLPSNLIVQVTTNQLD